MRPPPAWYCCYVNGSGPRGAPSVFYVGTWGPAPHPAAFRCPCCSQQFRPAAALRAGVTRGRASRGPRPASTPERSPRTLKAAPRRADPSPSPRRGRGASGPHSGAGPGRGPGGARGGLARHGGVGRGGGPGAPLRSGGARRAPGGAARPSRGGGGGRRSRGTERRRAAPAPPPRPPPRPPRTGPRPARPPRPPRAGGRPEAAAAARSLPPAPGLSRAVT